MIPIERQRATAEGHARRNGHVLGSWEPVAPPVMAPACASPAYQAGCTQCSARAYAHRHILQYGDAATTRCTGAAEPGAEGERREDGRWQRWSVRLAGVWLAHTMPDEDPADNQGRARLAAVGHWLVLGGTGLAVLGLRHRR